MGRSKKQRIMRHIEKSAQAGRIEVVNHRTGKREMVDIQNLKRPMDLTVDQCREYAAARVGVNLRNAKHPLHHLTADGTIVTPDPTLEYYLSRLSEEHRKQFYAVYGPTPEQEVAAPKAVAVNRKYYGRDMYEGLL